MPADELPNWFSRISPSWWRALIVRALAPTVPTYYDAAALDQVVAGQQNGGEGTSPPV